jgi:hypothetical protein
MSTLSVNTITPTSGNSIVINSELLIKGPGGDITLGSTGSTNLSASYADYSVTASYALNGRGNTGDITFEGIKVIGAGTGSGDGNNYSTIELVPDNDLYNNDQYLILDPTGPNHIHVRAGGTIDNSSAMLILGGENTNVSVDDQNQEVRLKSTTDVFVTQSNFTTASGFSSAVWDTNVGVYTITINDPTVDLYNVTYALTSVSILTVVTESNYTNITILSTTASGYPAPITFTIQETPPVTPTNLDELIFEIRQLADSYVEVNGSDVTIEAQDDVRIYANDTFSLRNYSPTDPISIRTDYNGRDYGWEFNEDGNTVFPYLPTPRGDTNSGDLITNTLKLGNGLNEAVISTPNGMTGYPNSQRLVINPGQGSGSGEGGDIYLWAGRGGVDSGTGGDVKVRGGYGPESGSGGYVRIEGGDTTHGYAGFVEIKGGNSNTAEGGTVNIHGGLGNSNAQNGNVTVNTYDTVGAQKSWIFDTEGLLTIPDLLQLPVRATDPGMPVEGMIMASGSAGSSVLYYYNGTIWNALF